MSNNEPEDTKKPDEVDEAEDEPLDEQSDSDLEGAEGEDGQEVGEKKEVTEGTQKDDNGAEEDKPLDGEESEQGVSEDESGDRDENVALDGMTAVFKHPQHLMAAAELTRDSEYEKFDAYSPFPIHGMDEAMGLGRSWIPWVTTGAGLVGLFCAIALQFGTMTIDWPMIIGGKPFAPWPSFVPIMFELTVLIGGVTTGVVMLIAAGCFQSPDIIDERITQDRFVLWISAEDPAFSKNEVRSFLEKMNPEEVNDILLDNES